MQRCSLFSFPEYCLSRIILLDLVDNKTIVACLVISLLYKLSRTHSRCRLRCRHRADPQHPTRPQVLFHGSVIRSSGVNGEILREFRCARYLMWKPQTRTRYKQRWNSAERKPWLRLSRAFDYVWDNAATTRKTRREKATRRNGGTKERRQREKERKAEAVSAERTRGRET